MSTRIRPESWPRTCLAAPTGRSSTLPARTSRAPWFVTGFAGGAGWNAWCRRRYRSFCSTAATTRTARSRSRSCAPAPRHPILLVLRPPRRGPILLLLRQRLTPRPRADRFGRSGLLLSGARKEPTMFPSIITLLNLLNFGAVAALTTCFVIKLPAAKAARQRLLLAQGDQAEAAARTYRRLARPQRLL